MLQAGELLIDRLLASHAEAEGPAAPDAPYDDFPSLAICLHHARQQAHLRQPAETTPKAAAMQAWRQFIGE